MQGACAQEAVTFTSFKVCTLHVREMISSHSVCGEISSARRCLSRRRTILVYNLLPRAIMSSRSKFCAARRCISLCRTLWRATWKSARTHVFAKLFAPHADLFRGTKLFCAQLGNPHDHKFSRKFWCRTLVHFDAQNASACNLTRGKFCVAPRCFLRRKNFLLAI